MLVAIISYLLLKFYLMRLKRQSGGELGDKERAEAAAKVNRITKVVDHIVALWLKCLIWVSILLFAMVIITLCVSLLGTAPESAWVASIESCGFDAIAQIASELGVVVSLLIIALSLGIFAASVYLIFWSLFKRNRS
jgi:hypothetical protein